MKEKSLQILICILFGFLLINCNSTNEEQNVSLFLSGPEVTCGSISFAKSSEDSVLILSGQFNQIIKGDTSFSLSIADNKTFMTLYRYNKPVGPYSIQCNDVIEELPESIDYISIRGDISFKVREYDSEPFFPEFIVTIEIENLVVFHEGDTLKFKPITIGPGKAGWFPG